MQRVGSGRKIEREVSDRIGGICFDKSTVCSRFQHNHSRLYSLPFLINYGAPQPDLCMGCELICHEK